MWGAAPQISNRVVGVTDGVAFGIGGRHPLAQGVDDLGAGIALGVGGGHRQAVVGIWVTLSVGWFRSVGAVTVTARPTGS